MQTILGAGGSIGNYLASNLLKYTNSIRLVSRNPRKVNPADELFPADLLDPTKVDEAVSGADVVYLVAGFPYKLKVWQQVWPKVMDNTLKACIKHKAKLVFFDNIYLYDPEHIPLTREDTPIKPGSKKGEIRAEIVNTLLKEINNGNITALIARAPDFYGPSINNAVLNEAVLKPLKAGKKANWFCSLDKVHSFIWVPDAAKATAILGNDKNAYGQTWHLPTSPGPLTGKQYIEAIAHELGVKPRYQVAGKGLVRILGLFNPTMKEFVEMLYQFDREYVFDSSKFMKAYQFMPNPYTTGIKEMVQAELNN